MKTYVFTEEGISNSVIVLAALDGDHLHVSTDSSFNWIPIGREYTVTKAEGNTIFKIEGIPAKEFYKNYTGQVLNESIDIGIQFPFTTNRGGKLTSTALYAQNDENFVIASLPVKKGEKIRLGYGNLVDIMKGTGELLDRMEKTAVESLFVFSCVGRKSLLKENVDYELKPLSRNLSISGFYTAAEFNHIEEENIVYTQTMTLLALSEDESAFLQEDRASAAENRFFKGVEEEILHHLIKKTGDELNELNTSLETQVREKTRELRESYFTDDMTGLANRNKLISDLRDERQDKIALFHLKSFYEKNNFYGSEMGTEFLRQISRALSNEMRITGMSVYHIDLPTFAVTADNGLGESIFLEEVQRLLDKLDNRSFAIEGYSLRADLVMSVVMGEQQLLEKAGLTLDHIEKNLAIVSSVKEAIKEDRIVPYYQPIIDNNTGEIVKYESLMRMIDKEGYVISPYIFLEPAKIAGLYMELTRIMIRKTFEQFRSMNREFSINLIYRDIRNTETKALIYKYLDDRDLAERAIFEIVESEGIEDFDDVVEFIDRVKERGAQIAIDDFGTGYSNFMYLSKINVDILKIDGSIIKDLNENPASEIMAETILSFSEKLGIKIVGEFVHSKDVYKKVSELGIDYSQGYYFSPPIPAKELI